MMIHGVCDVEEVLEEFARDVFVSIVGCGKLKRHSSMWRQYLAIQPVPSDCSRTRRWATGRCDRRCRCCRAPGNRLRKMLFSSESLRFTHQVKFISSLWKNVRETHVWACFASRIDLENAPRRPGVDRRIYIAEGPFIGGNLPVGMHVPFAQKELQLLFGESGSAGAMATCETRGPKRHTRGIPTCRAWR